MYLNGYGDDDDLGIALPAIGGAITSIGGLIKGSKDPGRLAGNLKAYNAAMAGLNTFTSGDVTMNPVEFLRQKSIPGGWATEKARADAEQKYKAVLAARAKQPASTSPKLPGIPLAIGGPVVAGLSTGPLLLAGAAALGIYFLSDSGKRRR